MNKKTVTIASGAVGLILLTACGGTDTYSYQVSGLVQAQQVDYDCPGEDIAMDAVAYVTGSGKGSSSGGNGSSKKTDSDTDTSSNDRKAEAPARAPAAKSTKTATPGSGTVSKAPSKAPSKAGSTPTPKNKGVTLKTKPEKAEKLKGLKVPKVKYTFKPSGCETEYEIFIMSGGSLYEQDVRKADYDKCLAAKIPAGQKAKLFPLCTKG